MKDLTLSLQIENLLVQIEPSYYGMRDTIEQKPYKTIAEALRYRLPIGFNEFESLYGEMGERSLSQLKRDGYDIEILIKDLKRIINKGE